LGLYDILVGNGGGEALIFFLERRAIQVDFEEWCSRTGAKDCTMNFVAWLQMLHEEPAQRALIQIQSIEPKDRYWWISG